jgi:acyl-coenzyme A thioesterase PaaI-like protein
MADFLPDLTTWNCFACGQSHEKGLRLRFTAPGPERIRSDFEISASHVGLGRIVHGGIVATVFDEAMVWTLYRWRYQPHVTARMEQRFRGVIEADVPLVVEAEITEDRGRRRKVEAALFGEDDPGKPLAEASGIYLPAAPAMLTDLPAEQVAELDAVLEAFREADGA